MPTTFRDFNPDQLIMLPPDLRDWLPEGHLAYQVADLVGALDLNAFFLPYAGDGRRNRPYNPEMMVRVLVYGYCRGVFSSRRLARYLREDVGGRYLAAGNLPAHRTLCEFRRRHLNDFQDLFVQVVGIAGELGLTKLGTLAVDSSKVRANASKRKAMTYERMGEKEKALQLEIAALLEKAEARDRAEDAEHGESGDGEDIPHELRRRQDRLAAIRDAKQRLEAKARRFDNRRGRKPGQKRNPRGGSPYKREYGEPDPKAQHNFTDPESCIMKTSTEGFQQAYNAQAVVDGQSRLIVAVDVTASASDADQLENMIARTRQNTGSDPGVVLADSGYADEEVFRSLEDDGIDAYVAQGRESKQKAPGSDMPARKRMAARLASDLGRTLYATRKHIAEPPFGWIKHTMGFRRFSVRGREKVRGEWELVCLALNVKRLNMAAAT